DVAAAGLGLPRYVPRGAHARTAGPSPGPAPRFLACAEYLLDVLARGRVQCRSGHACRVAVFCRFGHRGRAADLRHLPGRPAAAEAAWQVYGVGVHAVVCRSAARWFPRALAGADCAARIRWLAMDVRRGRPGRGYRLRATDRAARVAALAGVGRPHEGRRGCGCAFRGAGPRGWRPVARAGSGGTGADTAWQGARTVRPAVPSPHADDGGFAPVPRLGVL